jgi:hypothetical protein
LSPTSSASSFIKNCLNANTTTNAMMGIIHSSRPSRARTHREPITHITTVAIAVADAVAIAVARRLMWDFRSIDQL